MTLPEFFFRFFYLQLPTKQPLWTPEEGLQGTVLNNGEIKEPPRGNAPIGFINRTPQAQRELLFETMKVNQNIVDLNGRILVANVPSIVERKVQKMISNRARYQSISGKFANPIRWVHVALLHEMEGEQNFNTYLGNGQRWNKKTTIVPKGRGPFKSFDDGAIDAIIFDKLDLIKDWSIGNTLLILEKFNGYGYSRYKGINSPYIWSGSNHYTSGKYIADGVYSKSAVSTQIGIALLYKRLLELI